MTEHPETNRPDQPKFCPLRHAIVPGPPSLDTRSATLEFKDVPCAQSKCAWYWPAQQRCAVLQLGIELRALPSAIIEAMPPAHE